MANTWDHAITGFEGGDFTGLATLGGTITAASARTGSYGLNANAIATAQYGASIGSNPVSGTTKAAFFQFFFKLDNAPSVNTAQLGGIGLSVAQVNVDTDLTWNLKISGFATITTGSALPLNTWLRCIVKYWNYGSDVTVFAANNTRATAQITNVETNAEYGTLVGGGAGNVSTLGRGVMGGQTAEGPAVTWSVHYDDALYLVADGTARANITKWDHGTAHLLNNAGSLFSYNKVYPFVVTAQGAHDDFATAGNYTAVSEIPMALGSVSSSTLNAWTSYRHATLTPYHEVEALTLRVNATQATGNTEALTVNNTETSFAFTASTGSADINSRYVTEIQTGMKGAFLSKGLFDILEFGVRVKTAAASFVLKNLFLEVLGGPATVVITLNVPSPSGPSPSGPPGPSGPVPESFGETGGRWALHHFDIETRKEKRHYK